MTDIPEDVMEAADSAWLELASLGANEQELRRAETRVIASAILAERERCAAVADESRARSLSEDAKGRKFSGLFDHRFAASKAGEIATSIRNPEGYLNAPSLNPLHQQEREI